MCNSKSCKQFKEYTKSCKFVGRKNGQDAFPSSPFFVLNACFDAFSGFCGFECRFHHANHAQCLLGQNL